MILHYPIESIQMEQRQQWDKAANYLYDLWKKNPFDKNNLLTAGLEQWYYMTIYEPIVPSMEILEFDLCMNRLAEIMRFWTENEPLEAAYLSLFGYCMKVQPFWFCLDSQKDDIYAIQAAGMEMIAKAHDLAPDDAVISAIADDSSADRSYCINELKLWDDCAMRDYFLSVLANPGNTGDGSLCWSGSALDACV